MCDGSIATSETRQTENSQSPRGCLQFSLRTMFIFIAIVALILGLLASFPKHIGSYKVSQLELEANTIVSKGTALELDFSRRWGRTYIGAVPRDGLGKMERAELFWLEGDEIIQCDLTDKGQLLAGRIGSPRTWPLVFCVVKYYPFAITLEGMTVSDNGMMAPICVQNISPRARNRQKRCR